ncbi:MAG: LLM class flavin-dependent oxidoreductase [Gammaproteobacteria bacterium]|nr:LLM class flavin-dependent oxidoreductase [Gammaproteobacteria bacterium]
MKFSNFLFPSSFDVADDHDVIKETLREAQLCDQLGMQALWLAEHHFDGICAYVDPVAFAAALATATTRIDIGFAVAQMSLHHPIRMAEQMALIDNLSDGRLIVGLGRGTAYNIYDYQGYGIDPEEAQGRLLEAEALMIAAWTGEDLDHRGEFFQARLPLLRPQCFSRPHPRLIRACSGEASMLEMARAGRPFLMNVQSNEVTRKRMDLYRATMREAGFDDEAVQRNVDDSWVWRNVYVADTDAAAEREAVGAFERMIAHRSEMRRRIYEQQGVSLVDMSNSSQPARAQVGHSLLCGSPATVSERIEEIRRIGVGGLILQFRLGPMSYEQTERSIRMFMSEVAPAFQP